MDDVVRSLFGPGAWIARDDIANQRAAALDEDCAARVIALLVERAGGSIELDAAEIEAVQVRLVLITSEVRPSVGDNPGLLLEVRTLAPSEVPEVG